VTSASRSVSILFIVNPIAGAGQGRTRWRAFERRLGEQGIRGDHAITSAPGDALRLAAEAGPRCDVVVAVGGDGTVFEVCSGLLSTPDNKAALAIVPFGTGNDSAAAIGIRSEAEALEALRQGSLRQVDVIAMDCLIEGQLTRRHAFLFAAVGISGELLRQTTPAVKRLFGQKLAYPVGLLRALLSYRAPHLRVTCDERVAQGRFLFVGASNTERSGGGMRLAPGARIDDGLLNVNLIQAVGRWEAFLQVRRLCAGLHVTHPKVRYHTARRLEIEADPPLEVQADGDLVGHTPASFEVRPGALRVLAMRPGLR
jgi:diacylglycerol kinase (ATP)